MPALTELGKQRIKGIVDRKILDNIDAWQNWKEISTLRNGNCKKRDIGYLICKELTFRVLLSGQNGQGKTLEKLWLEGGGLVYERESTVESIKDTSKTLNLDILRNQVIKITDEREIIEQINQNNNDNTVCEKYLVIGEFFKAGTAQTIGKNEVIFLIDNYVEYFHRTNFAHGTCSQLLSPSKLPSLNNLKVIGELLGLNIYDLSYFRYSISEITKDPNEIQKFKEEARKSLKNIIAVMNSQEREIIRKYLQITNYRGRLIIIEALEHLSTNQINNNEYAILCYVAHSIKIPNICEEIRQNLQDWLEFRGRIFSKQPEIFDFQQFLDNFRVPNMINNNYSFWHDRPSIMVFLNSNDRIEYNFSSAIFDRGNRYKFLCENRQNIQDNSLLQNHIKEFIQESIDKLHDHISDRNELGRFLNSLVLELFVDEHTINLDYHGLKFDLGDDEQETIKILLRLVKRRQMRINLSNPSAQQRPNQLARMSDKISAWQEKCEMIKQNSTEEYILNDINNITEPIPPNLIGIKSCSPLGKENIKFIIDHGLIGAIWSTQLQHDTQQRIDDLLTGDIKDLPRRYGTRQTHSNLLLLWDDANRLPPDDSDIPNSQNQPLSL